MPVLYLCKAKGCGNVIEKRGYCEEHKHLDVPFVFKENRPQQDHSKMYQTARWKKLRAFILDRDEHRCAVCGGHATIVDHIQPHEGNEELFYDENNLQLLCRSCHGTKTAGESQRKARKRRQQR